MRISDWSSDVCSSDLLVVVEAALDPVDLAMEEVDQGPEQVREIVLEPGLAQQLSEDVEDVVQRPFAGLRLRSEEHTSELQSLMRISYAVFCLKKKKKIDTNIHNSNTE